ncbi:MAG: hypothetical protein ACT4O9_06170 [Blastocatellia bacterium]
MATCAKCGSDQVYDGICFSCEHDADETLNPIAVSETSSTFEPTIVPEEKRNYGFWLKIGGGVLLLLIVINAIRINRTEPPPARPEPIVENTLGTIVVGTVNVPAKDFLSYRIAVAKRSKVFGRFTVGGQKPRVGCYLLDSANFEKWRNGSQFATIVSTGVVPGGRIERTVEPGTYFLVLDNRHSAEVPAVVDANFSVE